MVKVEHSAAAGTAAQMRHWFIQNSIRVNLGGEESSGEIDKAVLGIGMDERDTELIAHIDSFLAAH